MLDAQRYRAGTYRAEVHFTRLILWSHLALGALVILMMLFHEIFSWALLTAAWYLITSLILVGLLSTMRFCRVGLALAFLSFSLGGVYFLGNVLPDLHPETSPLIPHALLPFWLGLVNVTYAAGAACMAFNDKVRKACTISFSLW